MLGPEREPQTSRKFVVQYGDIQLSIMTHAPAIQVGRSNGSPGVVHDAHLGVNVDRAVAHQVIASACIAGREREETQASIARSSWRIATQPRNRIVGVLAP